MFPEWATKRVYKYILRRILGKFILNELDLEHLDVQLYAGTLELKDLEINVDYLNQIVGPNKLLCITSGKIGTIKALFPWNSIISESSVLEFIGLELVVGFQKHGTTPDMNRDQLFHGRSVPDISETYTEKQMSFGKYFGVDYISSMVRSILLGLKVIVENFTVKFEGELPSEIAGPKENFSIALSIPFLEYYGEDDIDFEISELAGSSQLLTKCLKFRGIVISMDKCQDGAKAGAGATWPEIASQTSVFYDDRSAHRSNSESDDCKLNFRAFSAKTSDILHSDGFSGKIKVECPLSLLAGQGIQRNVSLNASFGFLALQLSTNTVNKLSKLVRFVNMYCSDEEVGPSAASSHSLYGSRFFGKQSVYHDVSDTQSSQFFYDDFNEPSKSHFPIEFWDVEVDEPKPGKKEVRFEILDIPAVKKDNEQLAGRKNERLKGSLADNELSMNRFVSNWMHWGYSELSKIESNVFEEDLALSVDEFFDCIDSSWNFSQTSQMGRTTGFGMAETLSAMSDASVLAISKNRLPQNSKGGISFLALEYSMSLKLEGCSVILFHESQDETGIELSRIVCGKSAPKLPHFDLQLGVAKLHAETKKTTTVDFSISSFEISEAVADLDPSSRQALHRLFECGDQSSSSGRKANLYADQSGPVWRSHLAQGSFQRGLEKISLVRICSRGTAPSISGRATFSNAGDECSTTKISVRLEPVSAFLWPSSVSRLERCTSMTHFGPARPDTVRLPALTEKRCSEVSFELTCPSAKILLSCVNSTIQNDGQEGKALVLEVQSGEGKFMAHNSSSKVTLSVDWMSASRGVNGEQNLDPKLQVNLCSTALFIDLIDLKSYQPNSTCSRILSIEASQDHCSKTRPDWMTSSSIPSTFNPSSALELFFTLNSFTAQREESSGFPTRNARSLVEGMKKRLDSAKGIPSDSLTNDFTVSVLPNSAAEKMKTENVKSEIWQSSNSQIIVEISTVKAAFSLGIMESVTEIIEGFSSKQLGGNSGKESDGKGDRDSCQVSFSVCCQEFEANIDSNRIEEVDPDSYQRQTPRFSGFEKPHWGKGWSSLAVQSESIDIFLGLTFDEELRAQFSRIEVREMNVSGTEPKKGNIKSKKVDSRSLRNLTLFGVSNKSVGRGNGTAKGENVLVSKSENNPGIELTFFTERLPGVLVAHKQGSQGISSRELTHATFESTASVCIRGGTVIGHGARFDWPLMFQEFTQLCELRGGRKAEVATSKKSHKLDLFVDIFDFAIVYEGGDESCAWSSEDFDTGKSPVSMVSVGCVLALTAMRVELSVNSNTNSNLNSKPVMPSNHESAKPGFLLTLFSRDLGLSLVDNQRRLINAISDNGFFDYSLDGLLRNGFIQVAKSSHIRVALDATGSPDHSSPPWTAVTKKPEFEFEFSSESMAAFQKLISQIQAFVTPDVNLGLLSQQMDEKASQFADVFNGHQRAPEKNPSDDPAADSKSYGNSSTQNSLRTAASWYNGQELKLREGYFGLSDPNSPKKHKIQSLYPPSLAKSSGKVRVIDLMLTFRLCSSDNLTSGINNWKKTNTNLEFRIGPVLLDYESFDAGSASASRLKVRVKDIRVYDIKRTSGTRMTMSKRVILGYHWSDSKPRESGSPAVNLILDAFKKQKTDVSEVCKFSVSLLPLRLQVDQSQVEFLADFFSTGGSQPKSSSTSSELTNEGNASAEIENALQPFFQSFEIFPFSICVDYTPTNIDFSKLKSGEYIQLINTVPWTEVRISMKHVKVREVRGWAEVGLRLTEAWSKDIAKNQLHNLVAGAGPISPLFALAMAASQLVSQPLEDLKSQRGALRGIRKGLTIFLRSLSSEALGLGATLAHAAKTVLVKTERVLDMQELSMHSHGRGFSGHWGDPGPSGPIEGLVQACELLCRGLEKAASGLVTRPLKAYVEKGPLTAARVTIRAVPSAVLAPATAVSEAVETAFLGLKKGCVERRKLKWDVQSD